MTWDQSFENYNEYLILEKNYSENTRLSYLYDLKKCRCFLEEILQIQDCSLVKSEDLQFFLYEYSKQKTNERSQARLVSTLKNFFSFLYEENITTENPSRLLDAPKLGIYLPDTLSFSEIKTLLNSCEKTSYTGKRNQCMIETLFGLGLRVSELVNLKLSDLFLNEDFVRVLGKGNKVRLIPLTVFNKNTLIDYLENTRCLFKVHPQFSDCLFLNSRGKNLTRVMVFLIVKDLAKKSKIIKKISPHSFRHSFATELLKNGVDLRFIQELLGHSSITTTEIYTHFQNEELHKTILEFHPRNHSQ